MKTHNEKDAEIIREGRRLKRLENDALSSIDPNRRFDIDINRLFEDEDIRNQRQKNKSKNEKNNIDICRFFENDNIREQRRLNKLQNEINPNRRFDIRKNGYCEICNTNVQKSSIAKHLRSIKHLENQSIIPNNFFNENLPSSSKINTKKI